jgi:hypothetical protein|tara:strand:- start:18 stop:260 length:243 start_codon:yes stop_codon:yes gene_type:complete
MDSKKVVNDQENIKRLKEAENKPPFATINVIYTPIGGGYNLDIKCSNAHLIGTGRSERIASKIRKEVHRQRYHQMAPEAL